MINQFKRFPFLTVLAMVMILFMSFSFGKALASVGVRINMANVGAATDINIGAGVNWSFDGAILSLQGVNWQAVSGLNLSQVNWVNANIISQGINWESVRVALPNNGNGTNWQAFGV